MSAPYWLPGSRRQRPRYRNPWDRVVLAGRPLPGRASIREIGLELSVQHKAAAGQDYGRNTVRGIRAPEFTIELEFLHSEEWAEFQRWIPILVPAKDPTARDYLSISHPLTEIWRIYWVLVLHPRVFAPRSGASARAEILVRAANAPRSGVTHSPQPKLDAPPAIDLGEPRRAPDLLERLGRTRGKGLNLE